MTLSIETGLLGGAGLVIGWLVKELVTRHNQYEAEKKERKLLTDAHLADLKDQIAAYRDQAAAEQADHAKFRADSLIQERASMTLILANSDKMGAIANDMRQTVTLALTARSTKE